MERSSFWYLKQFLDAIDNDDLTYEEKCKATYCLCYYGIKGVFPPEANGMDKMYAKSNEKLFEGQDAYREERKEKGANGGKVAKITDEEIKGAYIELYHFLGRVPTEKEVIEKCGGGVERIAGRKVWKEDKDKWIEKVCIDDKDVYTNTQDVQNLYKDIHVHTYNDF